jgi:RHS repeat-associated protein
MKKYILFLFLFSSVVFAQPNVNDYENDFLSLNNIGNYPNFYQELVLSDFIYGDFQNPSNEVIGSITINNNILSVNINKSWPQQGLRLGIVKHLDIYPILPNIELGAILSVSGGVETGYFAKIVNNDFIIYSPYFPENLSTAGQIAISYPESMELPFLGLGGSGNIKVGQNKIFFEYYIDSWGFNSNPSGIIYTFPEWYPDNGLGGFGFLGMSSLKQNSFGEEFPPTDPGQISFWVVIPDTDLGVLQCNGQNTIYKAKIENEQVIVYTTENLPPVPVGGSLAFVYDLSTLAAPKWYKDEDRDGYGSPNNTATGTATPPSGYVANNADCDDSNAAINPTTVWYLDQDSDGYGSLNQATITGCVKPIGYVIRSGDCNDSDATLSPDTVWFKNSNNPNVFYPAITGCEQPGGYTDHYSPVGTGPGSLPVACVDGNNILNPETAWYYDADADGYGNNVDMVKGCTQPANYVSNNLDCNDQDAGLNPNTVWYQDQDGDTYGSPASTASGCTQPIGYVANATDYNDGTPNITNIAPQTFYYDGDGDGFGDPGVSVYYSVKPTGYVTDNMDCNDSDSSINPNTVWYRDADGDSYGTSAITVASCGQPTGYVRNASDYDDGTPNITNIAPQTFYYDGDGDGFGDPNSNVYYSTKPVAYVTDNTDCNDSDSSINPNTVWYYDGDADGYGNNVNTVKACTQPANYVSNNLDCNDGDAGLNPNTVWYQDQDGDTYGSAASTATGCTQPIGYVANAADYNDGTPNITNIAPQTFYYDGDGDGFGDPGVSIYYSFKPTGYVTDNTDCNDSDSSINPNTVWYRDADGDSYGTTAITVASCGQPTGYVRNASDYDDGTPNITNIAPQTFYYDGDGDGFGDPGVSIYYSFKPTGYVIDNTDCNDSDSSINPNRVWYQDSDGDSYGTSAITALSCTQPIGYVPNAADYDDKTANITNIAPQTFFRDADGDTFGNPSFSVYYSAKPIGYVIDNTDCNDEESSLNPNTRWYADNDGDGLGDPSNYLEQCTAPAGNYVRNNTDNCPLVPGTDADCSSFANPSVDRNYIISKTYKQPSTTPFSSPSVEQAQVSITYYDGLGRPIQQIENKQSASGKDIITHIGYDDFGRKDKEYLPYVALSSNMAYEENAEQNTKSFYYNATYENTQNPFSEKAFEASPLNRIIKQAAPGTSWEMGKGHEIKIDYQTNTIGDSVKYYSVSTSWLEGSGLYEISFSDAGTYAENELYKNVTYDENSGTDLSESAGSTVEFKNKEGQVVLKRTYDSADKYDTYYVYDIYGNLTYVLPPKVSGVIDDDVLNGLCYQYKYDNRNRLVEKKLPGKQWEFIVYDKLDRPVATGPAFSPFKGENTEGWLITKYDAFSRPIYTGWISQSVSPAIRKSLQDDQNAIENNLLFETKQSSGTIDEIPVNYSNVIEPINFSLLTVNYYDDYDYPNAPSIPTTIEDQDVLANAKGLATGSWTRVLTTALAKLGETTTIVYDDKGRPIRTRTQNHFDGYTNTDSKLDFTGKALFTITEHKRTSGDNKLIVREDFTYSPQDRLLTHTHQINGGTVQLLTANKYDPLGQLESKHVGDSIGNARQKVDFTYNIRGWLTGINNIENLEQDSDPKDLFAFKINYDKVEADPNYAIKLYNGNIAETAWTTGSDFTGVIRRYGYLYDKLNRLQDATYQTPTLADNKNYFGENIDYDKNGNIIRLERMYVAGGSSNPYAGPMDNLGYFYKDNSNQLMKVTDTSNQPQGFKDDSSGFNDSTDDYDYDNNGNLIKDENKNITKIEYNYLNLPKKITFGTTGTIEYIYNAAGQKLEKIITDNSVVTNTNYLGGFQYKDNVLQFFPTAEGYVKNEAGVLSYVFQYKDHLGNVRVSYVKNPVTQVLEIIEENNYYPFGLKHEGYNPPNLMLGNHEAQKYKFLGQERQDELGLNWDTFRYRNYDYAIGRFMGVDPITEKFYSISTYQFAHNNPVWKIELEGLEGQVTTNQDIVNREPVYMTTNIIINTTNIQSAKPQNSRPGVAMFRMGIGVENSYTKEVGNENGGASATATAYKANVGISICMDAESVEYGMTVGQISADGKVGGQTVGEGQFTTFSAEGSYNIKTGEQKSNIDTFTGEVNTLGSESKQTEDLKFSFNAVGAYIEANLTEIGNNFKDFGNLVTSYLQGATQSYFNQNNTSTTNITPVK